jgi:hypothetical protein
MNGRAYERLLWSGAVALVLVAVIGWRGAVPDIVFASPASERVPRVATHVDPDTLALAASVATDADLFRSARHPSPLAYRPELEGAAPPLPRPPKPALQVTGMVGGPLWEAVLEGVPNRDGSVLVHSGDTLSGLRVRAIRQDTVIIDGMDTTWRLTVRRAW